MRVSKTRPMIVVSTILIQTFFLALINVQVSVSTNLDVIRDFLPLANLTLLILSGLSIVSIKQIEEQACLQAERYLLKEHLRQVEGLLNTLKVQKHEHIRHIQTIQAMLYLEESAKAREYIDGIAESYWSNQEVIYTDSPALTALLNSRRKVAESKQIDFQFAIKCAVDDIPLPSWDLSSILGNLLDNALEAVIQEKSNRRVALEIKNESNRIVIYISNTGPRISEVEKSRLFEPGFTTKESEARGYGLYIVKTLVDSYGGTIKVVTEPKTTFIISLPQKGVVENDKRAVQSSGNRTGKTLADFR
jgi:two-component system sensor histidine kinase AgrC